VIVGPVFCVLLIELLPDLGLAHGILGTLLGPDSGCPRVGLPEGALGDESLELRRRLAEKLFPFALWIPGILHIMHNITSNLCDQLTHYKVWVGMLKAVNGFLYHRWQLDVWLAACFLSPESQPSRHRLTKVKISMMDHRWGTMIAFLERLLEVEDIVRRHWDFVQICRSQGWPHRDTFG
jgi:hypothetical protein